MNSLYALLAFTIVSIVGYVVNAELDTTFYAIGCENTDIKLSCPAGKIVVINRAFYGRVDAKICSSSEVPSSKLSLLTCYKDVSDTATKLCGIEKNNNKDLSKCTIPSNNGAYSDPCVDTYKYTQVNYACV